jgi:hypothetical protein
VGDAAVTVGTVLRVSARVDNQVGVCATSTYAIVVGVAPPASPGPGSEIKMAIGGLLNVRVNGMEGVAVRGKFLTLWASGTPGVTTVGPDDGDSGLFGIAMNSAVGTAEQLVRMRFAKSELS